MYSKQTCCQSCLPGIDLQTNYGSNTPLRVSYPQGDTRCSHAYIIYSAKLSPAMEVFPVEIAHRTKTRLRWPQLLPLTSSPNF